MVKLALYASLVLSVQLAVAQSVERETVTQSLQWAAVTSHVKVSKRLSVLLDGQLRQADQFHPQQYQFRTGLDIKLNDHFSIVPLGYVYTWNYLYGKQPAEFENNEHRIWQQVIYAHKIGRVHVEHRLRLEQRFLQHHHLNTAGEAVDDGYSIMQNRIRYRLQARIPFNHQTMAPGTYYGIVYDELFKSWGENVTYESPDQNRIFAGVGYQFEKNFSMHLGGMYQLLIKRNGLQEENNIGVFVQVTYNVNLMKK